MKIVVTDACIFIDVIELQLTGRFFGLNLDIHTTADVLIRPNNKFWKAISQATN
jgi:hypothetical protein